MLVNNTDSNYLENTTKLSGIELSTYNYSIDNIKKAAFLDELNNVLNLNKSVDFNPVSRSGLSILILCVTDFRN